MKLLDDVEAEKTSNTAVSQIVKVVGGYQWQFKNFSKDLKLLDFEVVAVLHWSRWIMSGDH